MRFLTSLLYFYLIKNLIISLVINNTIFIKNKL